MISTSRDRPVEYRYASVPRHFFYRFRTQQEAAEGLGELLTECGFDLTTSYEYYEDQTKGVIHYRQEV